MSIAIENAIEEEGVYIVRGYFISSTVIDSATIQKYVKEQVESQMREEQLVLLAATRCMRKGKLLSE
jgi:hypothetical protein